MATNNTVNRIELIGYMGAMPEMRFTANGVSVTNFSLATNRYWTDAMGEQRKATDWHRVTTWGRLAEVVNEDMATGKRVRIVASQVLFLDYDRANPGLVEAPEAEEALTDAGQLAVEPQPQPKRRRRTQAA
jgi:single stranded DNA-binding protein